MAGSRLALLALACAALGYSGPALGQSLPNLVCREQRVMAFLFPGFRQMEYESSGLFRFTPKGLFLSDSTREEYFYNTVSFVERVSGGFRFRTGYKSLLFADDFKTGTVVQSDMVEIRVSNLICTKT